MLGRFYIIEKQARRNFYCSYVEHCTWIDCGAEEDRMKRDTGMLTNLPVGDSGTRRPETLPAQDIDVSTNSRLVS